jgi:nucleoside-diphosphate-sugar epimerase
MRAITAEDLMGHDAVVNLGGLSNDPTAEYDPEANREMNTVATESTAVATAKAGIGRYVFASSCSIYDFHDSGLAEGAKLDEGTVVKPKSAYSRSKFDAEEALWKMYDSGQLASPVILRKGTVYGSSPRMRYDLVVNAMVKDAVTKGVISVHRFGEMWRPLVHVNDVADAYARAILASGIDGEIFNIVGGNYRISDVALRVAYGLRRFPIQISIEGMPGDDGRQIRSYRVSGAKASDMLGFSPTVRIESSVHSMAVDLEQGGGRSMHPRHYNIEWMRILDEANSLIETGGPIFSRAHRETD